MSINNVLEEKGSFNPVVAMLSLSVCQWRDSTSGQCAGVTRSGAMMTVPPVDTILDQVPPGLAADIVIQGSLLLYKYYTFIGWNIFQCFRFIAAQAKLYNIFINK